MRSLAGEAGGDIDLHDLIPIAHRDPNVLAAGGYLDRSTFEPKAGTKSLSAVELERSEQGPILGR